MLSRVMLQATLGHLTGDVTGDVTGVLQATLRAMQAMLLLRPSSFQLLISTVAQLTLRWRSSASTAVFTNITVPEQPLATVDINAGETKMAQCRSRSSPQRVLFRRFLLWNGHFWIMTATGTTTVTTADFIDGARLAAQIPASTPGWSSQPHCGDSVTIKTQTQ